MFYFAIYFSSCSSGSEKKSEQQTVNLQTINAIQKSSSLPDVKYLKDVTDPQTIMVPKNKTSLSIIKFLDGDKKTLLMPPSVFTPKGGISGGLSHFNSFSTEQGLALSSIACSYLDRSGYLWFGTYGGGVSKYDGRSFVTYNSSHGLANNLVLCVKEDRLGNMWFGTQGGGVSKYDGRSFQTFNILNGLADNVVYHILEDKKGDLWFATKNGGVSLLTAKNNWDLSHKKDSVVNKITKKIFKTFDVSDGLAGNTVRSILEDKTGNIWFTTEGEGICKYNGREFVTYNKNNGLPTNTIWFAKEDRSGNLWLGTQDKGVCKYDGKTFVTYNSSNGLANNIIWSITESKKGDLWFGSEGGGVSVLTNDKILDQKDSSLFVTYNTTHGLANNVVFSITEDNTGNLWFGTYGGGVSKFNGNSFVTFNSKQGLASNVVFSVAEDKDKNLWFGSYGGGVSKYNGKTFTTYNTSQGLANNTVWCITQDKKNKLWFGTYGGGVSCFDGNVFINYNTNHGLPHNIIRCITEDKEGNLWFGTEGGGVSKFDGQSFSNYSTKQGLAHNVVRSICQDKTGKLWFGTEGGGVSKFDGKTFTNYTIENGLANNVIRSICEDKAGHIWFATQAGLSCFVNEQQGFLNYTVMQGLPDNYVTQVLEYKNGKLLVGTNNGIAVFEPNQSITSKVLAELELYNVTTNYPVKDINVGQNAMFMDSKGIVWAGTGDDKTSLVRMDYQSIPKNTRSPIVAISRIKINEQKIDWYSITNNSFKQFARDSMMLTQHQMFTYGKILTAVELDSINELYQNVEFDSITAFNPLPCNLILPYEHNSVSIEFNALELSNNFLVNYQYKLEGYDKHWSPVLKKNEASFGNINEGDYTFLLKAQSPDGVWSQPLKFKFKVLPPFYRTIWAYLFYIVAGLLSIRQIIRWRTATFKKRQKELEKIVDERTAEVILQKEEAEKQKEIAEHQKELVQEKQKEIVDSINYAKRIQYALLSHDDLLKKNLPNYFVFFQPKDIVSGDFYWATEHKGKLYFAVCDSTGHGVPGAFMSLLNIGFLSEAIKEKELDKPHDIFNYVRHRLIESISKEEQQDGMDGILMVVNANQLDTNSDTIEIEYAAANNAPLLIKNGIVHELPKDKMPIGKADKINSFTLYKQTVQKNEMLYLYTDGYADQFGGPKGKKFKYKTLVELLTSVNHLSLKEQQLVLQDNFNNWKGDLEQVDDVCLVGIKF